ncbi:phenylalanine--tRNA ligase beta subunit-related protein [Micromonospora sp. NPDC005324]|uniref:B3/B4 domain-containing protein n=1 Tax=Micromonospora sp. NPDC005324 TaxID=3157033 RepID=UPI0033B3F4DA
MNALANANQSWIEQTYICPDVTALRPDYSVVLIVADGLQPGRCDELSERALIAAEKTARNLLHTVPVTEIPHIAQWRETYRRFGANPKRTRPSVEGLMRRVENGLPRIDRLTDIYNAISIQHILPVGGEDLDAYVGPLRLTRATGKETFDTTIDGKSETELCEAGEIVWRDDIGATCRRWNWRQCTRTRLGPTTHRAVFILEWLTAVDDSGLKKACEHFQELLHTSNPGVQLMSRRLDAHPTPAGE